MPQVQTGQTATGPNGEKIKWDGSRWVPLTASDDNGNKLAFINNQWIPVENKEIKLPEDLWGQHLSRVSEARDVSGEGKTKKLINPTSVKHMPFNVSGLREHLPGVENVKTLSQGIKDMSSFKYWGRALKPEFWKNVATNFFTGMGSQLVEPTSISGIINSVKQKVEESMYPGGPPTDKEELSRSIKQAISFLPPVFIAQTVASLVTDPLGTLERDPLAVAFSMAGVSSGAKEMVRDYQSGKPMVPKNMRKILPELKKWATDAQNNAPLIEKTIEAAKREMAQSEQLSKWKTSPKPVAEPRLAEVAPMPGQLQFEGGIKQPPDITGKTQEAIYKKTIEGRTGVTPLEIALKGIVNQDLIELFAGMPVDDKILNYIREGKFIPSALKNPTTGQETKIPAKVVGIKSDWRPDFPKYTVNPDPTIPEPMTIEKTAGSKPNGMPGYRHELVTLQAQKDVAPTKYKYQLENPIRWFDSSPLLKESLYYPWRSAEHITELEKHSTRIQVGIWERSVPRSMQKELGDYAIAKQRNGPQSLQLMGVDPSEVMARAESNPAMMKVYNEARNNLEKMFVRINEAREVAGLPPLPKVENYFTFARGVNELDAIGHPVVQEKNPDMLKRHLYEPAFSYKKRENVIAPMNRRFYAIYEHYMNNAARYSNYAPVVAKGRVLLGDWGIKDSLGRDSGVFSLGGKAPNLARMTSEWVDRIAGKHIGSDPWFSKVLRGIARNTGSAVIAFNPRSAILQPTSLQNTYIEIGGKYLYKGIEEYALKERRQFAMRTSEVLTGRAMDVNLEDLWADGVSRIINKARSKASAVGSYPLRALDAMAAQMSWLGAYERAITPEAKGGLGLLGRDAVRYADDVVVRTQASAKVGDLARIQTTPIGKLASIFQTFVINNWNYWSKDVMGWKNPEMVNAERVKKVTRLIWSSLVINTLFEDVIGINSPLPAPEHELIKGIREGKNFREILVNMGKEVAESVPVIGGSVKYTTPTRTSLPQGAQQIQDVTKLGSDIMESFSKWDLKKISNQDLQTLSKFFGVTGAAELFKIQRMVKAGQPWWKILVSAPAPKKEPMSKIKTGDYLR